MVLLSFTVISPVIVNAQWLAGGDISLTCTGSNTYIVRLVLYRDCHGITAPNTVAIAFNCSSDPSHNFTITNVNRVPGTGQEITTVCSSGLTKCSGGSYPGFGMQEYVYEEQITLPPCNTWTASWNTCCRRPQNTLVNPNSTGFHFKATIDNLTAPCASSPSFIIPPIAIFYVGQTTSINYGVTDPDGDSLSYSLVSPFYNNTSTISWMPGFSATQPITSNPPVTIDSVTGTITLSPDVNQTSTMVLMVEKYRYINGVPVLIGTSYRDMNIFASFYGNRLPVLSGMDPTLVKGYDPSDTIFYKEVCLGDTVSFAIWGYDQDTFNPGSTGNPEKFSIFWNQGIPQASFQAFNQNSDSAYALFNWVPTAANRGLNCFTATIRDAGCLYNGINTYSYCFFVRALNITVAPDTGVCRGDTVTFNVVSQPMMQDYIWKINGDPVAPHVSGSSLTVNTMNMQDGLYTVSAETVYGSPGSTCTGRAQALLEVYPIPQVFLGIDTAVSLGSTILLDAGPGYASYLWSTGHYMQTVGVDSAGTGQGIKTVWVEVTNSFGCKGSDTIHINFTQNPGLDETFSEPQMRIFPNPSGGHLQLMLTNFPKGNCYAEIFSQDGRLVLTSSHPVISDNERIIIDIWHLPPGLYYLNLKGNERTIREKFVLMK